MAENTDSVCDTDVTQMESKLKKLGDKIEQLTLEIDKKMKDGQPPAGEQSEEVPKTYAEITKQSTEGDEQLMRIVLTALNERENRKKITDQKVKSVVLTNVEEMTVEDPKKTVEQLLKIINCEDVPVGKVHQFTGRNNDGKFLKFTVGTLNGKKKIMSKLPLLRDAKPPFNRIGVRHDLTYEQRQARAKLMEKAKKMTTDQQVPYMVAYQKEPPFDPIIVKKYR